ncbi:MAG: AbrB family transcriptional regulator [Rhodomicrobium sp.]|nr:AbrB family transcriptional regulator [Rhodomicrobium sp.]
MTVLLAIVLSAAFLMLVAKWSRATAFYAAIPGALSYVMAMSMRSSADNRLVVLAQMLRLTALLLALPALIALSFDAGAPPALAADTTAYAVWPLKSLSAVRSAICLKDLAFRPECCSAA